MKLRNFAVLATSVAILTSCQCKTTDDSNLQNSGYNRGYDNCPMDTSHLPHRFVLDRVFYAFDRYDLTEEGRRTLERQAEWLKDNPGQTILIEGNCDERGTREYNIGLGERRANTAKEYLVSLGVNPSRISVTSNGKDAPWVAGSNPDAWAQNRNATTVAN
jgi:peptidoglycan-associated lipoprotein